MLLHAAELAAQTGEHGLATDIVNLVLQALDKPKAAHSHDDRKEEQMIH